MLGDLTVQQALGMAAKNEKDARFLLEAAQRLRDRAARMQIELETIAASLRPIMFSARGYTVGQQITVTEPTQRTVVTVTRIDCDGVTLTDADGVSKIVKA